MGPNPRRQPLRLPLRMRRRTRRDDAKKHRLIFVHHAPPSSVTRHPRRRPSDHTPASSAASRHAASHTASSSGVSGREGRREGRENRPGFSTRGRRGGNGLKRPHGHGASTHAKNMRNQPANRSVVSSPSCGCNGSYSSVSAHLRLFISRQVPPFGAGAWEGRWTPGCDCEEHDNQSQFRPTERQGGV